MTTPTSIPLEEQETTVAGTAADEKLIIWSCRRRHITAMRKHPTFIERTSGFHGTTEWAEFEILDTDWNPATGGRRPRKTTPEQRKILAERARKNFQQEETK